MRNFFLFCLRRLQGTAGEYQRHERWCTIPNVITALGIVGVVWYCYLFLTDSSVWMIPLLHIGIVLTDALDGIAADAFDQHSYLGLYLDPLRDRMHAVAVLGNLVFVSPEVGVIAWVMVAVIAEGWTALLFSRVLAHSPRMAGKVRTAIYGLCGLVALVQLYWVGKDIVPLSIVAGAMAVSSVGTCFFYAWLAVKTKRSAGGKEAHF
jgi:cardiolipin synthase (CMP-forming)